MSKIPAEFDAEVRQECKNRCGYCLVPQELVSYKLEIEHIFPKGKGGSNEKENICLACRECNLKKSVKTYGFDTVTARQVRLFNPRGQHWNRHFEFDESLTEIVGKTACGRATVLALQMNSEWQTTARKFWILTSKFPPKEFRK